MGRKPEKGREGGPRDRVEFERGPLPPDPPWGGGKEGEVTRIHRSLPSNKSFLQEKKKKGKGCRTTNTKELNFYSKSGSGYCHRCVLEWFQKNKKEEGFEKRIHLGN